MSNAEPYTTEESRADVRDWTHATPAQRNAAFTDLLPAMCAIAEAQQNELAITTLREIRAKRDEARP
jgi:hypothetical protein